MSDKETAVEEAEEAGDGTETVGEGGLEFSVVGSGEAETLPEAEVSNEWPEWAEIPDGMKIPKGASVFFVRFRAEWTEAKHKGDRFCIVWPLTANDEGVAWSLIGDRIGNAVSVLARQMLRSVDGHRVNWGAQSGELGNPKDFWREIGPRCRKAMHMIYNQTHMLAPAETADFLANCVASRTMT